MISKNLLLFGRVRSSHMSTCSPSPGPPTLLRGGGGQRADTIYKFEAGESNCRIIEIQGLLRLQHHHYCFAPPPPPGQYIRFRLDRPVVERPSLSHPAQIRAPQLLPFFCTHTPQPQSAPPSALFFNVSISTPFPRACVAESFPMKKRGGAGVVVGSLSSNWCLMDWGAAGQEERSLGGTSLSESCRKGGLTLPGTLLLCRGWPPWPWSLARRIVRVWAFARWPKERWGGGQVDEDVCALPPSGHCRGGAARV